MNHHVFCCIALSTSPLHSSTIQLPNISVAFNLNLFCYFVALSPRVRHHHHPRLIFCVYFSYNFSGLNVHFAPPAPPQALSNPLRNLRSHSQTISLSSLAHVYWRPIDCCWRLAAEQRRSQLFSQM